MFHRILLLAFLATALGASGLLRADVEVAVPASFLVDLHLHGSLSEGYATMAHHAEEAVQAGYDGLWWSDHQARASDEHWPLEFPLDNNLRTSGVLPAPSGQPVAVWETVGDPGLLTLGFRSAGAKVGSGYLRVDAEDQGPGSFGWRRASLQVSSVHRGGYRSPLLALPEFRGWARVQGAQGQAGCLLRVTMSGVPDGVTEEGTVRVLELIPGNFTPPPAAPGVERVFLGSAPMQTWLPMSVRPQDWIHRFPGATLDASMLEFEIEFFARAGGRAVIDFDHLELDRTGPTGAALFAAQRQHLEAQPPLPLFQYVGCEVEGPYAQPAALSGSRDHLIALLPALSPPAFDFPPGTPGALGYPATGIAQIQGMGGVAVLAHPFGTRSDGLISMSTPVAASVSSRVRAAGAWGADAIEIGYPVRGRTLAEHVELWDGLSADGVFVTGIGVSDNHDMQPWAARTWQNWASWIVAPSNTRADLIDAVRAGQVFFGDPHRLDPNGSLILDHRSDNYSMGAVVPISPGSEYLRVRVEGAPPGCEVVILRNGSDEVHRRAVTGSGSLDTKKQVPVAPGDWVRAELRDAQDQPIAFTNPVYYVAQGVTPPPWRAP